MYLAGSVHALTADAYPLNPAISEHSMPPSALVEEIDLRRPIRCQEASACSRKGCITDGRTSAASSPGDRRARCREAEKYAARTRADSANEAVDGDADARSARRTIRLAWTPSSGSTSTSITWRLVSGKQVIGLETAEYQIDRFDKMPDAMQEQLLRSELAEMETEKTSLRALLTRGRAATLPSIEKMLLTVVHRQSRPAYNSLITERNRNWMPQLEACLKRSSPCFVIVGCGTLSSVLRDCWLCSGSAVIESSSSKQEIPNPEIPNPKSQIPNPS
jgi:hypothetical protein